MWKAGGYEIRKGDLVYSCCTKPLTPELHIAADDRLDVVFIDAFAGGTDGIWIRTWFIGSDDVFVGFSRDLRVRDHWGQKQGMSMAAFRAYDATYGKSLFPKRSPDGTPVIPMYGETAWMTAGAFKLMELKIFYYGIVECLCKCIEIPDCYC